MITRPIGGARPINPFALGPPDGGGEAAVEPFPPRPFRLDAPRTEEALAAIERARVGAGAIDPAKIQLGDAGVPLDLATSRTLVLRKMAALERALFGVEADHDAFPRRIRAAQSDAYRLYLAGRDHHEMRRSPELVAYHRLADRAPEQFVARVHEGRVLLAERIEPAELPIETAAGASQGIAVKGLSEVQEEYLRTALDTIFPRAALSILSRSQIRLVFASELGEVSPTALAHYGEGCAISELACPDFGRFWPFLGEAMIPLVAETTASTDALLSIVVHELAHALDWALGAPGQRWSDSAEWQQLYARCDAFPTERSAQGPDEFFAECAAIYLLGRHVNVQPLRDVVAVRGDLPAPILERLERLFTRELAARDREGTRTPEETPRIEIERAIARTEAVEPSFARSFHLAAWHHILAIETGGSKENAKLWLEDARAKEGGDEAYSNALQKEIETR